MSEVRTVFSSEVMENTDRVILEQVSYIFDDSISNINKKVSCCINNNFGVEFLIWNQNKSLLTVNIEIELDKEKHTFLSIDDIEIDYFSECSPYPIGELFKLPSFQNLMDAPLKTKFTINANDYARITIRKKPDSVHKYSGLVRFSVK